MHECAFINIIHRWFAYLLLISFTLGFFKKNTHNEPKNFTECFWRNFERQTGQIECFLCAHRHCCRISLQFHFYLGICGESFRSLSRCHFLYNTAHTRSISNERVQTKARNFINVYLFHAASEIGPITSKRLAFAWFSFMFWIELNVFVPIEHYQIFIIPYICPSVCHLLWLFWFSPVHNLRTFSAYVAVEIYFIYT